MQRPLLSFLPMTQSYLVTAGGIESLGLLMIFSVGLGTIKIL
jgi:hypothetical protein